MDIFAAVPYHLIQSIRLVHALAESKHRVHVPAEHADKFSRLIDVFGATFTIGIEGAAQLYPVTVSHPEPRTAIGTLERPLIFPHGVTRRCRELWSTERTARFSFVGLVTDARRRVLGEWLRRSFPDRPTTLGSRSIADRLRSRLRRMLGSPETVQWDKAGELVLWSSRRGREFPGKSWDDEYHALLARSQFVLCPSGDYVWSYRFFEATLCGAIPVVEKTCPAYDGFAFRTLDDPAANLHWNREEAEHNFALCCDRLTVPQADLDAEIDVLLSQQVVG